MPTWLALTIIAIGASSGGLLLLVAWAEVRRAFRKPPVMDEELVRFQLRPRSGQVERITFTRRGH